MKNNTTGYMDGNIQPVPAPTDLDPFDGRTGEGICERVKTSKTGPFYPVAKINNGLPVNMEFAMVDSTGAWHNEHSDPDTYIAMLNSSNQTLVAGSNQQTDDYVLFLWEQAQ